MFGNGGGMVLGGSDSEMAYNEFCDIACDPHNNDTGCIGLHHDGMGWGLKCHDNYIHHMQRTPKREWEWGGYGTTVPQRMAIYIDSSGAGAEIYRNVIYDAPQGLNLPFSAVPETYANNLFVDVMLPVQAGSVQKDTLEGLEIFTREQLLEALGGAAGPYFTTGIYKTAWRDVYPEFNQFIDYFLNKKEDVTQLILPVYNNICVNLNVPRAVIDPTDSYLAHLAPMPPESEVSPDPLYGRYENNRYLEYDPGFVDYAKGNVQLTQAAAVQLGIEWVDLSKIGSSIPSAKPPSGFSVSGLIKSYNPQHYTSLALWREGEAEAAYTFTIDKEKSGSGQREQPFAFEGVEPGIYTLTVSKAAHTNYIVHNIAVEDGNVDLTADGRPDVRLMTLRCGDINGDGNINNSDLTIMWQQANYNRSAAAAANELCDLNGDGLINNIDLTILWLAYNYNRGAVEITLGIEPGLKIYVAPDGDDNNPGTMGAPLQTLTGARNKVRLIKAEQGLPAGGITVYFRGGIYPVTETVHFAAQDSGTEAAPVCYAASPGETPVFSGGSYMAGSAFLALSDPYMWARLYPEARGKVLGYDLYANGFTYGELDYAQEFWQAGDLLENDNAKYHPHGFSVPRMQVFIDDEALYLARFPNKISGIFAGNPYNRYHMLQAPDIIEGGMNWENEELTGAAPKFRTHESRIKNWRSLDDIIVFGMFAAEYDYDELLATVDPAAMTVTLDKSVPDFGIMERGRYAFANVFEELDRPGEYFIDKSTGMLYLYPTTDMSQATVKVSRFAGGFMFELDDASYITFGGLTAELTKGSVMKILGGRNVCVEGCTFKNYGLRGVKIGEGVVSSFDYGYAYGTPQFQEALEMIPAALNGFAHSIRGTTFLNTGYEAACIASGHIGYREKGGALFENNTVKHSGLIGSTYRSGLTLSGCGITVKNNAFMFCRGQAISGCVIDTEVIYNEFADSPCEMAEDTGTIYFNYCTQNDGVQICYNYFHDVTNFSSSGYGFAMRSAAGFDTNMPFGEFSHNVVYNYPAGVSLIDHTSPRTVIGNIQIDTLATFERIPTAFIRDFYNGESGLQYLENDNYALGPHYNSGLYSGELWRQNYPGLYEYYEYMRGEKQDFYPLMSEIRDNVVVYLAKQLSHVSDELPPQMAADPKYGRFENNHYFTADPGFADYRNYNFQLTKEAAQRLGVEWIDMSKIGVAGLAGLTRVSGSYADPDRWTQTAHDPLIQMVGGQSPIMVSFWRYISPGIWEWAADDVLFPGGVGGLNAIPGATYTAYYPGCENYPAQFLGGFGGEYPPGEALTFTVDPQRSRWDYYVFNLEKELAPPLFSAPQCVEK
jgi:hypothetical protein